MAYLKKIINIWKITTQSKLVTWIKYIVLISQQALLNVFFYCLAFSFKNTGSPIEFMTN